MKARVSKNPKMLIVAGEASGDDHASRLVRELKALSPRLEVTALAGKRTYEVCDKFIFNLAKESMTGFIEPFKKLPLWFNLFTKIENYMDTQHPDFVVLVDFFGFNSHVMKMAYLRGIPVYYYIAPQVWASRGYRTKKLAKYARKVFVIYPFEPEFHARYGSNAEFLGNPLLDIVPEPRTDSNNISALVHWRIGFLPGSRESEITRLLPDFEKAFRILKETHPGAKAYLFAVKEFDDAFYKNLLGPGADDITIVRETDYALRSQMDFMLTCSGTATLENALLGLPMLVAYKMSDITYRIAKFVIKVGFISLPNNLAGREVVKEMIQDDATPEAMAWEARKLLDEPELLDAQRAELLKLRAALGARGVAARAAKEILKDVFPLRPEKVRENNG